MKDFLGDDLIYKEIYKEIPYKPLEKIPTITIVRILHTFEGMDINI